jgi:hypothetical protein
MRTTFEAARRFGLTEEETWLAMDESLNEVGPHATTSELLDELAGALARRILVKERNAARGARSAGRATAARTD